MASFIFSSFLLGLGLLETLSSVNEKLLFSREGSWSLLARLGSFLDVMMFTCGWECETYFLDIGNGASFGSCTRGCDGGGIDRSIHFPKSKDYYFFFEFGNDGHLVTRLGSGDSGDGVLRLLIVIPHCLRFLSKFKQIYYINCYDSH